MMGPDEGEVLSRETRQSGSLTLLCEAEGGCQNLCAATGQLPSTLPEPYPLLHRRGVQLLLETTVEPPKRFHTGGFHFILEEHTSPQLPPYPHD